MNKLIAWFARNTVAANMLMVGIILSGILSYFSVGKEMLPTVQPPGMNISIAWPGASPQEVEEQLILRIEEAIGDMPEIDRIYSTAREHSGNVSIQAGPKTDMDDFMAEVKARLDAISGLPRDIEPPRIRQWKMRVELINLILYGNADEKVLKDLAKEIRDEIGKIPGASNIELLGTRDYEVSIELSEEAMRRYSLTFDDISSAVRRTSVDLSGGAIKTDTGQINIRARNRADNQDDFDNIIIRQLPDGGSIRLKDVATVIDGFEDQDLVARMDGSPAILFQIRSTGAVDVVETSQKVKDWLKEYEVSLPDTLNLAIWNDTSELFGERLETISGAALGGLALVFLILIISLRPKVAIWVTVGIFTAYAGAFILMPSNDVTINILSLFGFLLVLGVVVDDAIVVGESIHHESMETGGGVDSAIIGTQMVAKPVFFAVVTTMLMFAPWLFMDAPQAQLMNSISITILGALTFSLIEAFFILPAHLSKLKPRKNLGKFFGLQKKVADGIINFAKVSYRPFAYKAVKYRYVTVSIFIVAFMLAIALIKTGHMRFGLEPEFASDNIQISVSLPEGTSFERSKQVLDQVLAAGDTIEDHFADRKREDEKLVKHNFSFSFSNRVRAFYGLESSATRDIPTKEISDYLRAAIGDIPDAEELEINFTFNDANASIGFNVFANDPEVLRVAVQELEEKLMSYEEIQYVVNNINAVNDELHIKLKPGAESLGIDLQTVSRQIRQAYYGEEIQRLARPGGDVKVMVRYPREDRRSLDSLQNAMIRTSDGREVPLFSIIDLELAPGVKRINRRNRTRNAFVYAGLPIEKKEELRADLDDNFFKDWEERNEGVSRSQDDSAQGEAQFLQEVTSLYGMALFIMYALLAIAFRSYFLPILIMIAIPYAFMGAVFGHYFLDLKMAIFSYFGVAAAVGVVVNDNLVLVDYANKLKDKGIDAYHASVEAATARFRPILLTTVTTVIGLLPLMLDDGLQMQDLKPTVVALSSGVFFAFFITLFLVPALYGIGEDARLRSGKIWRGFKGKLGFGDKESADQAAE